MSNAALTNRGRLVPPLPECACAKRSQSVIENIQVIRIAACTEYAGTRQDDLEYPGPEQQGDQDFTGQRRVIRRAQAETPLTPEHDGNPEWNADKVIQMVVDEPSLPETLEDPPVDEIEDHTGAEQRITQVQKGQGLSGSWEHESRS